MNREEGSFIPPETKDLHVSEMATLWKKYRLPGKPPPTGSIAEQRMCQYAEEYLNCVIGETTKKEVASNVVRNSSSETRRDLHNKLSIMIYGVVRDSLHEVDADKISEFATELLYPGYTFKQLEDGAYKEETVIR